MSNVLGTLFQDIANAIREKTGDTATMKPAEFPDKIAAIEGSTVESDLVKYVTFVSWDGSEEYGKRPVINGDDCPNPVTSGLLDTPVKESTITQNFTFSGWATTRGGAANSSALENITEDITLYAAFTASVRYYTITFYDDDKATVLNTEQVTYGGSSSYIPTKQNHGFVAWTPSPTNVTADMDCYASWVLEGFIADSWETIAARAEAGTAAEYYNLGDTKNVQMTMSDGTTRNITVRIVGFGCDTLSDGSGMAGITIAQVGYMEETFKLYQLYSGNEESTNYLKYLPEDLQSVLKIVKKPFKSSVLGLKVWGPDTLNIHDTRTSNYTNNYDTKFQILEGLTTSAEKYNLLRWDNIASRSVNTYAVTGGTVDYRSYLWGAGMTENVATNSNKTKEVHLAICFCV